jgi:L-iditol 2-dehydrogenase
VAIDPLMSCGQCDQCRAGRAHTCRNQRFLGQPGQSNGALTEYVVLPAKCCYPVPDRVTSDQAVMVEPLSIAVHAQRMSPLDSGSKVAILGAGPIGLSVLLVCRAAADCKAYVTDLIPERLDLAGKLGAAWTGNASQADVVANIREAEPFGVDLVFECAGKQETLDQGVALLKPGGTLLIVGIPETDNVSFPVHTLRRKELTIKNVRRQNECISPALNMVASGAINVDPLVTHHFSLNETKTAFDLVSNYRDSVVKALIHVSQDRR